MKRVLKRTLPKYSSSIIKILCIIALCFIIVYLRTENGIIEKEEVIKASRPDSVEEPSYRKNEENGELISAILVICANRPDALRNHLTQLLSRRPSSSQYHVIISQDGDKHSVRQVAEQFVEDFKNVTLIQHEKIAPIKKNNYPAISAHYKWALDKVFKERNYNHVIITEDDLDIGIDFFSFFHWGKLVLDSDSTIWCVSAWNDNGAENLINPEKGELVWRTDFFPGLGWMLKKELWEELSSIFPVSYWDDWMRKPEIRKGRSCVRPEISRTSHNMKLAGKGSSGGMYKDFLSRIGASQSNVDFTLLPISLVQAAYYDAHLIEEIKNAKTMNNSDITLNVNPDYNYKISYNNIRDWNRLAKIFKIMTDIRGGMQRTAYYGVVTVTIQKARIFLVPNATFQNADKLTEYKYDSDWDKQHRFLEFENHYCKTKKYPGKCDPHSPEMIAFFKKKGWKKRLDDWGEMIVV